VAKCTAIDVDGFEIVARAVLKRAGAVDHCIDATEQWPPIRRRHSSHVRPDPGRARFSPSGQVEIAGRPDDVMPLSDQPGGDVAADQPIRPDYQHSHARCPIAVRVTLHGAVRSRSAPSALALYISRRVKGETLTQFQEGGWSRSRNRAHSSPDVPFLEANFCDEQVYERAAVATNR